MRITEFINESKKEESKKRCKQCGMTNCSCKPGTCKCKPIEGWIPNKGFRKAMAEGLNEFAPASGDNGGNSERWYTDDELADIIGDDWFEDFDVSNDGFNIDAYGEKAKKNLVGYANAWFDDKGYNVNVMGVEHNDVDHDLQWYIVGSFHNPRFANEGVAEGLSTDNLLAKSGFKEIRKTKHGAEYSNGHEAVSIKIDPSDPDVINWALGEVRGKSIDWFESGNDDKEEALHIIKSFTNYAQGVAEDTPDQKSLRMQYPNYYQHRDSGTIFRTQNADGQRMDITPDDEEWDDHYKQQFKDMPTPNDGGFWNDDNTGAYVEEDWNKVNKKDKTSGMSQKAVNAYRRENPGSKLKTAVTTKPSKLKKGSKAANRRKSFCARMGGNKGPMKKPNGKPTPKALALRRWNCESIEELQELLMLAEQFVNKKKNESI